MNKQQELAAILRESANARRVRARRTGKTYSNGIMERGRAIRLAAWEDSAADILERFPDMDAARAVMTEDESAMVAGSEMLWAERFEP